MCGSGTVGGSAVSSPWTARHISTAVMWWVGDSPRPTGTLSPSLPSYPSVTTTPPPPSREFPVPLLCRGRAEPEGSARTHPVPPQTLLPLPPPPHAHSSNQAFPFISQSPSPFRHTDGGGGAPEAVTIGTLGALLQDEQQPPSPPLPTWSPPTPGGSSKGWAWVGLAQCPLGGGYMTS